MMKNDSIYNNITDVLNNIPDNYKILEETIDIDVQKDFFESSKFLIIDPNIDKISKLIKQLNSIDIKTDERKIILQKLAMIDSVEAYRAIEEYCKHAEHQLKDWSILSLQQSRMVLQSSLLDEQQVFISTGLGGKTDKLRYFLIFPYSNNVTINEIQQNALEQELNFFLNRYNGELEEIEFNKNKYASVLALIPLKAAVAEMIKEVLAECNQLGNYLTDDVIITNIKKFSHEEIIDILKRYDEES